MKNEKRQLKIKNRAPSVARGEGEDESTVLIANLRKRYPKFTYKEYSYKILNSDFKIFFNFQIEPNIYFKPGLTIKNINKSQIEKVGDRVLNNLIFHLGLIEMFSYWKADCSPEIEIQAGNLNERQIKWWKNLLLNGMGQFFYENKINPQIIIPAIKCFCVNNSPSTTADIKLSKRILIPLGGGKDSIVTLELLKNSGKELFCFSLNPNESIKNIIKIAGCKNLICVERKIDPRLLELNEKGFLNGHTPFSAYLAFLSALLAAIFDFKYMAFSQERSSNEGNLNYYGGMVNHQYSKSFDFENKFRNYAKKYLLKNVEYFSFLRPLYEIQIAKIFSSYPKYFNTFMSCNKGKGKKWCGNCPKCLFTFTIFYPFISENKLLKIFGKNLFDDKKLLPVMQELIGERGFKPFECVGTKKESLAAFYLSCEKHTDESKENLPHLLKHFKTKILSKYPDIEKGAKNILNAWNKKNNVPPNFVKLLKYAQKSRNF